jgi:hypothetical protein
MPRLNHLAHQQILQLRLKRLLDLRVRSVRLKSQALGVTKRFYVALPPGYASVVNRNRRFPERSSTPARFVSARCS